MKRLKIFLGIALGVNLLNCGIYGFASFKDFATNRWAGTDDLAFFCTCLVLVLFPGIFLYLAQLLVRNYFPDKELTRGRRRVYNVLGTIQILFALLEGFLGGNIFFVVIPSEPHIKGYQLLLLSLWAITLIAAALCNVVAAIALWRMMRTIRRNFRTSLVESFGS